MLLEELPLGVILEAEIELTDNLPLEKQTYKVSINEYASMLQNQSQELSLHYGRCSYVPGKAFLTECYSTSLRSVGINPAISNLKPEQNIKRNISLTNITICS